MVFSAFWMLFGAFSLIYCIQNFASLMVTLKEYERECKQDSTAQLALLEAQGNEDTISELQFLRFALLRRNLVSEGDIQQITDAFKAYGPADGKVPTKVVQDSLKEAK